MAKKKYHVLPSKHFFNIVVLSASALGLMLAVMVLQKPTNTRSNASGTSGLSLNDCTSLAAEGHLIYGGGVKLFNDDNFLGGDRLACAPFLDYDDKLRTYTDNFDRKDNPNSISYDEIYGSFQLKTESMKIRALGGCLVRVKLFKEYDAPDYALLDTYEVNRIGTTTQTQSFELPNPQDNKAKSMKMAIRCSR